MLFSILDICLLGSHFACKRHHKILNVLSTHTHTHTHKCTATHTAALVRLHTNVAKKSEKVEESVGGKTH